MPQNESILYHLPIVAIVGRPNVGKSTLFNRICGKRKASVLDTPGVTRDRNYATAQWEDREFLLIDTGGFELPDTSDMFDLMREQILLAIDEADAIIFLVDLNETDNPSDREIHTLLRRSKKPVFLAINKCDTMKKEAAAAEFYHLGVNILFPVSAAQGHGVAELLEEVAKTLPKAEIAEDKERIRIAVVGRQNVGKSTLVNSILGQKRVIVSSEAGTTRDAIDSHFEREGRAYTIIDTAGIRRRGKIKRGTEWLSVTSSFFSLERCDVALIMLDAVEGILKQDTHIAGFAADAGKCCILVINKWDLAKERGMDQGAFVKKMQDEFNFLLFAPIAFIAANTGKGVHRLFPIIGKVVQESRKKIGTSQLNDSFQHYIHHLTPPLRKGREIKIKYVVQTGIAPPTFTMFVNDPDLMHFSYERYLINQLREEYGFKGAPIRLKLRKKGKDKNGGKR